MRMVSLGEANSVEIRPAVIYAWDVLLVMDAIPLLWIRESLHNLPIQ